MSDPLVKALVKIKHGKMQILVIRRVINLARVLARTKRRNALNITQR